MKANPTIKDCIEMLEDKGLIYQLHWILYRNGFELYVSNPIYPEMDKRYIERNREAVYNAYIEIHYLI